MDSGAPARPCLDLASPAQLRGALLHRKEADAAMSHWFQANAVVFNAQLETRLSIPKTDRETYDAPSCTGVADHVQERLLGDPVSSDLARRRKLWHALRGIDLYPQPGIRSRQLFSPLANGGYQSQLVQRGWPEIAGKLAYRANTGPKRLLYYANHRASPGGIFGD